jgi:hypothetical protein
MGVVGSFGVGEFGQPQLSDISRKRGLGDHKTFIGECLTQFVLALDPMLSHYSKDCSVSLGFHGAR